MSNIWEEKRAQLNKLHEELQLKPEKEKMGFSITPGGILNAYREADVSFKHATESLDLYYEIGEIRLSPKNFLHLKALINAFDVADEPDSKSIEIDVSGLGVISWSQGQDVLINLETVEKPNAKTE